MPLTVPVAGRQNEGPAPLTITDLQHRAGCVGRGGGVPRANTVVWRSIGVDKPGFAFNFRGRPNCCYVPFIESGVVYTFV